MLVAVVFGLVVLWPETSPAASLNDTSVHFGMVRWARLQIDLGRVPLDGWYSVLGLGSAQFHHYQSLAHILTAYISVLGGPSTPLWVEYLLLGLWPISVYAGARLMGWDGWVAGCAAVVSPLLVSTPNFGLEHQAYTWKG